MNRLLLDFMFSLRALRRDAFGVAAIIMVLSVGIGLTTTVFSLLDYALLKPLPYESPSRLVAVQIRADAEDPQGDSNPWWSFPKYEVLKENNKAFENLSAYAFHHANLTGVDPPERLLLESVTPEYFDTLGIRPQTGMTLPRSDHGETNTVMISDQAWTSRYGRDPAIIGSQVQINNRNLTVVGIAPPGFRGVSGLAEMWIAMAAVPEVLDWKTALTWHGTHWHKVVGRLAQGVSIEQASSSLSHLGALLSERYPSPSGKVPAGVVLPLDALRADAGLRRALWIIFGAVGFVLLIAVNNVAALQLGRSWRRRRELSVRMALGASRWQVRRLLLIENLTVAALASFFGWLLASVVLSVLPVLLPEAGEGLTTDLSLAVLDLRALLFTGILSMCAGVLCSVGPVWKRGRSDISSALRANAALVQSTSRGFPTWSGRTLMVGGQIALTLVLVLGAGLLVESLRHLQTIDPGVRMQNLLTFRVNPGREWREPPKSIAFKEAMLDSLGSIPGVDAATVDLFPPFSGSPYLTTVMRVDDKELERDEQPVVGVHYVGPKHFESLGTGLMAGRTFSDSDRLGETPKVILTSTTAARLWAGQNPIGRKMVIGEPVFMDGAMGEVVGIVEDIHYQRPGEEKRLEAFLPALQGGPNRLFFAVRSERPASDLVREIRAQVRAIDPTLPIFEVATMEELAGNARARARFLAFLLTVFTVVALVLASVGVYGILANRVAQQRQAIGIRMALGADRSRVLTETVRPILRLAFVSLSLGVAGGLALSSAMSGLLFGIQAHDPGNVVRSVVLVLVVSLLAAYLPARHASRIQPTELLRTE